MKQYPWQNRTRLEEDLENIVTDHLLNTCPKHILERLLAQIKGKWEEVWDEEDIRSAVYDAEVPEPHTAETCADHALDFLMWKTVNCLVTDHHVRSQFDLLTMKIKKADVFVLKYTDPELAEKGETLIGIGVQLKGKGNCITFFPKIGPHFQCSWLM